MGGRNRRAAAAARRRGRRRGLGGARILEGGGREAEGNGKGRREARGAVAMGGAPWPGKVWELALQPLLVGGFGRFGLGRTGTLEEGDEVVGTGLVGWFLNLWTERFHKTYGPGHQTYGPTLES